MRHIFTSGGCNANSNTSALLGDTLLYAARRALMVVTDGAEAVIPPFASNITALSAKGSLVSVGSANGDVCAWAIQEHGGGQGAALVLKEKVRGCVTALTFCGGYLVCSTREGIFFGKVAKFEENKENRDEPGPSAGLAESRLPLENDAVISMDGIEKRVGPHTMHLLAMGLYGGGIVIAELVGSTLEIRHSSLGYKDPIRTIEICGDGREHVDFCCAIQNGKVAISRYDPTTGTQKRIGIIPAHKGRCLSARWANGPRSIITASDDGTSTKWVETSSGWECTRKFGDSGGPPIYNAMENSSGDVILQVDTGGFYKYKKDEGYKLARCVGGNTGPVVAIDALCDLIMTSSLDRTVRIYQLRGGSAVEVARPLISGYEMVSAKFLDEMTLLTAASENILRVLRGTQSFLHQIGEPRGHGREDLCIVAEMQELSLSNLPVSYLGDEDKKHIFSSLGTERSLSTGVFQEIHKEYGHPFEIQDVNVADGIILSCNKSSSPAHSGLFVSNMDYELVQRIDVHDLNITRISVSRNKQMVACVGRDRKCSLYLVVRGRGNLEGSAGAGRIYSEFREDGSGLACIAERRDHTRLIWDCVFSEDSSRLTTCGKDKQVITYKVTAEGLEILDVQKHEEEVTALAEGGEFRALGTSSGKVLITRVNQGPTLSHQLHNARINRLEIHEFGGARMLISVADDHLLRVFDLNTH